MGAQVISLFQRPSPLRDWSQQELAEFYRVENALLQAGMRIETERGVTDDGEPWFAFCRQDDGEVFIHFARIGSQYIIAGDAFGGVIKGWDFASLVRELIDRHPLIQMSPARRPSNIFLHPAALLIAVVGTAFFKTSEAKADDGHDRGDGGRRAMLPVSAGSPVVSAGSTSFIAADANQTMTLVAAAIAAASADTAIALPASQSNWRLVDADQLVTSTSHAALTGGESVELSPAPIGGHTLAPPLQTQDVSDWLALTTVLNNIGVSSAALEPMHAITPPVETSESASLETGFAENAAHALQDLGSPLMVVELAAGPLPDVSSVRLARDLGALDHATVIRVVELPQLLADFVANGRQVIVSDSVTTETPSTGFNLPPVLQPDPTAPSDHAPSDHAPVVETPDSTPVAGPPHVGELFMSSHEANDLLGRFVNSTPFTIISSGDDLIFYDSRIHDLNAHDGSTYTLVLNFDDGGSITLIGMAHADYAFLLTGG